MKILYTNHVITTYAHPLLQKLASRGCEIVMLLPENHCKTVGENVKTVDTTHRDYRICYSRAKQMWYGKTALVDLKKTIAIEKPDILVIVFPYFIQLFFDRSIFKILKKYNTRLVIREIPFQTPPFGKLNYFKSHPVFNENFELQSKGILFKIRALLLMYIRRFVYSKAHASLNYATHALQILPSYGIKQENIFVTYNTGDTDALLSARERITQTAPMLPTCKRILHVGRLVKWKQVDLLINAFCKIAPKFPQCELVIVGDGPEKNALMLQAANTPFAHRIIFTGAIHDAETLGKYMYESTIYVLAGMGGLSINDAMCYSLPVICSVCDGTEKDLISDGVNGFFFKEGDTNSLAEKIDLILSNDTLCKTMGDAAYRMITEKININTVTQRYLNAFIQIKNKIKLN
jgi:glycosyltransferase involved in cell wall biosynthesis